MWPDWLCCLKSVKLQLLCLGPDMFEVSKMNINFLTSNLCFLPSQQNNY